ncbi:hypothetical protein M0Q50_10585 [bacterium]|jgi:thymidylate kinase|nr:hypothetical protein [bacterium]
MLKNKLLLICGGDNMGKTSLIKDLCDYYDYKNIVIRHCDKPSKNISQNEILNYQFKCFEQEFKMVNYIQQMNHKFMYHNNIIIYDRFYLGEFVYGSLFRNYDPELIKNQILILEEKYIKTLLNYSEIYLITLTADTQFFFNNEDGKSYSQTIEEKEKELNLFKEIHELSLIPKKLMIKVDNNGIFRDKNEILNEVIEFIK